MSTWADIEREARDDPVLGMLVSLVDQGASREDALISCVYVLAEWRRKALDNMVAHAMRCPMPAIILPFSELGEATVCDKCEWEEAIDLAAELQMAADDIPSQGDDFAISVTEKARAIGRTIEEKEHVTDAQKEALENMLEGVRRWTER